MMQFVIFVNERRNMYIVKTGFGSCLKLDIGDTEIFVACSSTFDDELYTNCDLRLFDKKTGKEVTRDILGKKVRHIDTERFLEILDIVREIEEEK
jgi:hypothetical protein